MRKMAFGLQILNLMVAFNWSSVPFYIVWMNWSRIGNNALSAAQPYGVKDGLG